ncbi:putative hydrolase of the HAD superfamily [Mangrovibacterium diazotrophicum]|uniref:Putative hydrolase of the HAD superfamily n=2 Tax=Mangrovibacterium diazotrophicum TaxID=1261403 RepID=A0A419WA95_9BACT|nr:putative hydrolase of the HAD superfamily [Mangrovibacterium diazotrophicum]
MSLNEVKVIAFDADDTLWENENFFRDAEHQFCKVMAEYEAEEEVMKKLFRTEIQNLELYGYGVKAFILSLMETALEISNRKVRPEQIEGIIEIGKSMLMKDVILLDGIVDLLDKLYGKYRLVVATKGDLLDQERKLKKSGLRKYFHHIEIMTHKREENYQELLNHLDIPAEQFFMVGNSLKSDVLPVIDLGGYAAHIPYYTTWLYEQMDPEDIKSDRFFELKQIHDVLDLFEKTKE